MAERGRGPPSSARVASQRSERTDVASEDEEEDYEEEDELRRAARAGILLLEKNQELQHENAALRLQLEALQRERPSLHGELAQRDAELALLRDERKQNLLEVTTLRGELRAKSTMITDLLDREQRLKAAVIEASDAKNLAEYQCERLEVELEELARRMAATKKQSPEQSPTAKGSAKVLVIPNPAATYDSNQASVFTLTDYEELLHKWQRGSEENETLQVELRSTRKDLDAMRRQVSKAVELQHEVERLEKKNMKLQYSHDALEAELTEERALIESLRTMNSVYKKIADSRPFATECTCAVHPHEQEQELSNYMPEVLVETNKRLEEELRELRIRAEMSRTLLENEQQEYGVGEGNHDNNNDNGIDGGENSMEKPLAHSTSSNSLTMLVDTSAHSDEDHTGGSSEAIHERLLKKIQDLQEKLAVSKDMVKHTKQQWQAAIASQKALEECNRTAQDEITRLTQLVDYQMASLASSRRRAPSMDGGESGGEGPPSGRGPQPEDDEDKWVEETAPYPAPPGDLNSPLIKCLLDHWTTDKSKVMHLTDWLHHAIRGTGKPMPLRLEHLTSEVAAGFTQLLVPILRERHGVSVTIYRRDSYQVLSDMVLQAHQPSQAPSIFSTLAAKLTGTSPTPQVASAPLSPGELSRSNSAGSTAASEASRGAARRRRPPLPHPTTEAQFLYG